MDFVLIMVLLGSGYNGSSLVISERFKTESECMKAAAFFKEVSHIRKSEYKCLKVKPI